MKTNRRNLGRTSRPSGEGVWPGRRWASGALAGLAALGLVACDAPPAKQEAAPPAPAQPAALQATTRLAPPAMRKVAMAPDRLVVTLERRFARALDAARRTAGAIDPFGLPRGGLPEEGPFGRLAALAAQVGGRVVYVEPSAAVAWIQLGHEFDARRAVAVLTAAREIVGVRRDPLARGADATVQAFGHGNQGCNGHGNPNCNGNNGNGNGNNGNGNGNNGKSGNGNGNNGNNGNGNGNGNGNQGCNGKGNPHCGGGDGGQPGPVPTEPPALPEGDITAFHLPLMTTASAPARGPQPWHRDALGVNGLRVRDNLGRPVVVAVLDTGLTMGPNGTPEAPALSGVAVLPGVDFVNLDEDPADDNGHGTLMASMLASTGQYPGVAPEVVLMPVKVLDADRVGTEAALAAGLRYAVDHQADVISMSLAFPEGFIPSDELASAIAVAHRAGAVVLAATGNHGANEVAYPAAFGSVVAVGAGRLAQAHTGGGASVINKLRRTDYSGYGAPIDVIGPGGSPTHDYNLDGYPDGIPAMGPLPDGTGYGWFLVTGTSAATAQVAGVAALMLTAGADPADVPQLLQIGAAHLPGFEANDGFDTLHGAGAVNANRATKLASRPFTPGPERYVNPVLTLVEDEMGRRRAVVVVEVIDEEHGLLPGVTVLGHFRGDTRHDVIGETDENGKVLFASLPALGGTTWEFGVDAILDGPMDDRPETATVPSGFARFELVTFRTLASFSATGAGFQPSTFILGVDADALMPFVLDLALTTPRGDDIDPWLGGAIEPVTTIPEDLESWTPVPSLFARSYAMAGERAPTAIVFDRALMADSCAFADRWVPMVSRGAGFQPSTFILDGSYLAVPATDDEVIVRGGSLFFNDQPTTPAQLGLLIGQPGIAVIGDSESTCPPQQRLVTNLDVFPESVRDGTGAASWGGFTLSIAADAADPDFADWVDAWQATLAEAPNGTPDLDQTPFGASWGLAPFATGAMATALAFDEAPPLPDPSDGASETP